MSYGSGSSNTPKSADMVQAALAINVGRPTCLVLAFCKDPSHEAPSITQTLLRGLEVNKKAKQMQMGSTEYYLTSLGGDKNRVHGLVVTRGKNNVPATLAYLDWLVNTFFKGHPGGEGLGQFGGPPHGDVEDLVTREIPARRNGGMKTFMDKYNGANIMKTIQLKSELNNVLSSVINTTMALEVRGSALDSLLKQSDDLAIQAQDVVNAAKAVYWMQWRRHAKWIAMIVCAVITLILLIVIAVCASGSC